MAKGFQKRCPIYCEKRNAQLNEGRKMKMPNLLRELNETPNLPRDLLESTQFTEKFK